MKRKYILNVIGETLRTEGHYCVENCGIILGIKYDLASEKLILIVKTKENNKTFSSSVNFKYDDLNHEELVVETLNKLISNIKREYLEKYVGEGLG